MFAEKSFRRRSYAKPFFKLFVSAVCYPCTFRCKSLNMVCLFFKQAFRDKHWHINILVAKLLEHTVKNSLNIFPNCVAVRSYYHTAFYACVRNELCFFAHVSVPFRKILVHRCDGINHLFLVVCHICDSLLYDNDSLNNSFKLRLILII